MVVQKVHTTPPKEDKVDTPSTEAPTAQALVDRLGNKVMDDNPNENDTDILNFDAVKSEIICRMSSRLQRCWPDSGKSDCLVLYFRWSGFCTP
jgi:hypothetical protein